MTRRPKYASEKIAAKSVCDACLKTRLLNPEIDENDKTASFDGQITVYKCPSDSKSDIFEYAPVQVKGFSVNQFTQKSTKTLLLSSAHIDIDDMNNYAKKDGVIYFYVEINDADETKIYYSSLLPWDIAYILRSDDAKIELKMLTPEIMAIYKVCFEFCVNRNSQKGKKILVEKKKLNISSINIDVIVHDNDPARSILSQDIYPYASIANEGKTFFDKIKVEKVFEPLNYSVIVKGKKYYNSIQREVSNTGNRLKICDCLSILCDSKHTTFYFDTKGTVDSIIYDANFIIDFINEKEFYIGEYLMHLTPEFDCEKVLNRTINASKYFSEVKYVLDYLGIKTSKKYEDFTKDDMRTTDLLIDIIINGNGQITSHKDGISSWKVLGCDILVVLYNDKDERQQIFNYFNMVDQFRLVLTGCDPDNEDNTIPLYYDLKCDLILKYTNFDLYNFEKSIYQSGKNNYSKNHAYLMLLEIIHCYDKTLNRDFLEAGYRIISYLRKTYGNSVINDINELQMKKREDKLSYEDKKHLIALRDKGDIDLLTMTAISILLDNYTDIELALEKMEKKQMELFISYPIFTLYKKGIGNRCI